MIDTIQLLVHNISENWILSAQHLVTENMKVKNFMKNGQTKQVKFWGSLPSSHTDVLYDIDLSNNNLKLSFSMPKFNYGNNIFQLIPHRGSPFFKSNDIKETFNYFDWFMLVIRKNLLELKIDCNIYEVELLRLDLCFNKFFYDEQTARNVLEFLKKNGFEGQRKNSKIVTYKDSLMIIREGITYKIYHKGSEYKRNDMKVDIEKGRNVYSDKLNNYEGSLDIANRCLRFEVMFRKSWILDNSPIDKIFKSSVENYQRNYYCVLNKKDLETLKLEAFGISLKYFWQSMFEKFIEFCNQYELQSKINQWYANNQLEASISNKNSVLMKYHYLRSVFTKKQLIERKLYNRQTVWRNEKKLKKFVIEKYNIDLSASYNEYEKLLTQKNCFLSMYRNNINV